MNSGSVPYSDIRRARQIKKYRSELKKDLKRGKIKPAELFIKRDIFNIYICNINIKDILLNYLLKGISLIFIFAI